MTTGVHAILVTLILNVAVGVARAESAEGDRKIKDCGVNSLYLLLRLCSLNADLTELRSSLPDTRLRGLSMAEIQTAAKQWGLSLQGKRIEIRDLPIDRPMIALLKWNEEPGHFVVLEPVGLLGKSVLVLDFPRPAQIVAYTDLIQSGRWTGLVLSPITFRERYGFWLMFSIGLILAGFGLAWPWIRPEAKRRIIVSTDSGI